MNREELKDMFDIIGIAAIVASLIFVAFEIRTNTASNKIAIEQNYSANWLEINAALAQNNDLAEVYEKGLAGEEMTRSEARQFDGIVSMFLTQSFHMLRLYDHDLVSEAEVRNAFRALRIRAQQGHFRKYVEEIGNERRRRLILDPNGLDEWLDAESE
jgi:hypothetical protein